MKRHAQTLLLTLTGVGLLHATVLTDTYLRYVKAGLRPPLIVSGAVLLLLGLAGAASRGRGRPAPHGVHEHTHADADGRPAHDHDDGNGHAAADGHTTGQVRGHPHAHVHVEADDSGHTHGHDHTATPRIAWLLFLPALSLLFYAPPALGAYTAARANNKPVATQKAFAALPAASPLPMTLTDFTKRVQQDRSRALTGRTVRLTGFATPAAGGGGWYLTRIIFTCCAADSQTVKVRVYGTRPPPADTWLAVTGTWHPRGTLGTRSAEAALDVRDARPIAQPVNAYTDDLPLVPS
ncbi:TIGR03943 family putative permease subunit [Streptomyces sp. NPDC015171]|uniref:TIGR03943 family putative permease subunit n=1 Tax=Streptomyces sp. NPDC015171 TaxID=3364945 RepID=UPI0037010864